MYKSLLTLFIIACISSANAQVSLGPAAGIHYTKFSERYNGNRSGYPYYKLTRNWRAGIVANIPMSDHWAVQSGAAYATNYPAPPKKIPKNGRTNPNTLDVPVNLVYKTAAGKNTLAVGAGPFMAYHFKTYRLYYTDYAGNTIDDIPLFARLNLGVNATIGYEWQKGWFLRGHFQRVLTGMYSNANTAFSSVPLSAIYLTNFNFGVTAGYFFKMRSANKQPGG